MDLARQAVADGIIESIGPQTVRLILDRVDPQLHRTRYWRTTRIDARFKARAEKVLRCYANAEQLARRGSWVACADEVPNFQVLERRPIRRSVPGSIEQREFDYTRHGTVKLLALLVVHTGRMRALVLDRNNAANDIPALEEFRRQRRRLRGVYLIHDGGPSHIAGPTTEYFDECHGWWRPRLTPARASWPDQAELLIHAFGRRYLRRCSWHDGRSSSSMSLTPGPSTTNCTPTRSSGHGPIRRCAAGSRDIVPEFQALLRASDTRIDIRDFQDGDCLARWFAKSG